MEIPVGDIFLQGTLVSLQFLQHGPQGIPEGVVVVRAGNHLHDAAVTIAETAPVDGFHEAEIGLAILRDRDAGVAGQHAGHAGAPQQLVVEFQVGIVLQVAQVGYCAGGIGQRRGDEFQQGLGIVGCDPGMRERGTQRHRVGRLCDMAIRRHPQAFLLQPGQAAAKQRQLACPGEGRQFFFSICKQLGYPCRV